MALKNIVVDGFTHAFSNPLVQATVTLTGVPSVKCKAGGAGICKDGFGAVISAVQVPSAGATIPDPAPYNVTFSATAVKTEADGTLVLRVDDKTADVTATPQIPGSPPTPYPVTFHLKITDAGQAVVRSE